MEGNKDEQNHKSLPQDAGDLQAGNISDNNVSNVKILNAIKSLRELLENKDLDPSNQKFLEKIIYYLKEFDQKLLDQGIYEPQKASTGGEQVDDFDRTLTRREILTLLEKTRQKLEEEQREFAQRLENLEDLTKELQGKFPNIRESDLEDTFITRDVLDRRLENVERKLEQRFEKLEEALSQQSSRKQSHVAIEPPPQREERELSDRVDEKPINLSPAEKKLVQQYNQRQKPKNLIEVSETVESQTQRRSGQDDRPILEKGRGNYWIVTEDNKSYIIPKQSLKINEYNYRTIAALFICYEYSPTSSREFKLIKPGRANCLNDEGQWEVIEKGTLEFE